MKLAQKARKQRGKCLPASPALSPLGVDALVIAALQEQVADLTARLRETDRRQLLTDPRLLGVEHRSGKGRRWHDSRERTDDIGQWCPHLECRP